jgi:DNA polymerase-3 subunit epsilon
MTDLSFVALDVETANRARGSVCAIGLVVVDEGTVGSVYSWLCRPPKTLNTFDGFNTSIHGITAEHVASEPTFRERIEDAVDIIGDRPVVAHNAAFDLGAIRDGCDADGMSWPSVTYGCTRVWSRRELTLINYKLPIVAAKLGIRIDAHHDALEDARTCGAILLELASQRHSASVDDFAAATKTRLGYIRGDQWCGCTVLPTSARSTAAHRQPAPPEANANADPEHPLYGQVVVFTGRLALCTRTEAWELVARAGGLPEKSVTKNTSLLVIGDGFVGDELSQFHTGKAAKALALHQKGQDIEVLTESEFGALVGDVLS